MLRIAIYGRYTNSHSKDFRLLQGVIEARMESFNSAHAFGLSLVDQGHFAAAEIQENCEEMTLVKDELMESWDEKQIELSQSYELQVCVTA